MRARLALLPLLLLTTGVIACSVLLPFDPDGVPCDSTGACESGFVCQEDLCVRRTDGGEPCGGCPTGERCDEVTNTCVADSCDTRACAVNFECVESTSGRSACVQLAAPALGHACSSDSQCEGGRVCFKGAVPNANGFIRTGACLEPCDGPTDTCAAVGATCRPFPMGLDAGVVDLCVPDGLLTSCTSNEACEAHGLTCTVFDHPATGPMTICDSPLPDAGQFGDPCVSGSGARDAGSLCGNGLCVPRIASAMAPTCSEPCTESATDTTCPIGTSCKLTEFGVEQGFPVRPIPMCIPNTTVCTDCAASASVCGADAPRCTFLDDGPVCLSACTPDAGSSGTPECGPGFECQVLSAGPRCVPTLGCP